MTTMPFGYTISFYIIEELVARQWTIAEFTAMTGYMKEEIVPLLYDEIDPDDQMCQALSLVFETSPALWENLRKTAKP